MTAAASVRLYQEGHARSTGYQVTEWIDSAHTTSQLLSPFLMARKPLEIPDTFERVATPLDLTTYSATTLAYFEIRGGDVDPYPDILTNLALPGICYIVVDVTTLPHWDVDTDINTVSYDSTGDEQEFRIGGIHASGGGQGVRASDATTLYLTGAQFTPNDIGSWFYLTGMTTTANNGAVRLDAYDGERAVIFRPAGSLTAETCVNAYWTRKYLYMNTKPFLRKEARVSWSAVRVDGSPTTISSGTIGIINPFIGTGDYYLTDRVTLLFNTLDQAQNHMTSVRSYLEALQEAQNTIDENETFGTLGPFDYPSE